LNGGASIKITVIGGTGLIGSQVMSILRQGDHELVTASPSGGVDSFTGEGLVEALAGAAVVIENETIIALFTTAGRNLLAAGAAAGVRHHLTLSVVGADRLPQSGYLRAKVAQETMIRASGLPYTIIRSTQFFELLGAIAGGRDRVRSGSPVAGAAAGLSCRQPAGADRGGSHPWATTLAYRERAVPSQAAPLV
jgi:uncharacterized protein YbjT (DUF2867 family)